MNESDTQFMRRQAELCLALSRATFDLSVASRLRAMAEEFRARASRCDALRPPPPANGATPRHATS